MIDIKTDFSKPSKDCFLTIDKNGNKLKVGDILFSNSIPLRGNEPQKEQLKPIENYEVNLVIPHFGSFLVKHYVECYCEVLAPLPEIISDFKSRCASLNEA